jgi:hypothetical protein
VPSVAIAKEMKIQRQTKSLGFEVHFADIDIGSQPTLLCAAKSPHAFLFEAWLFEH